MWFMHVFRLYNGATHTLAKEASCNGLDNVWLEDIPRCTVEIVLREQYTP
jgi:hypothetical protein